MVLFDIWQPEWTEFKLYKFLKEFTLISFQKSFSKDKDIPRLRELPVFIMEEFKKLDSGFDIYCKLHHCTHYADLILKFGPLIYYATWHYEHHHQYGKGVSKVMKCYKNVCYTIHTRHQSMRCFVEEESKFFEIDYWKDQFNSSLTTGLEDNLPTGCKRLTADKHQFRLKQNVIRSINRSNVKHALWFHTKQFHVDSNGHTYCEGEVYEHAKEINERQKTINKMHEGSIYVLELKHANKIIPLSRLHPNNSFLHKTKDGVSLLAKWINSPLL